MAITSGGTRLPLVRSYRVITVVSLTLLGDGGTARSAVALDRDPSGPLVQLYTAAGTATSGHVFAIIEGY